MKNQSKENNMNKTISLALGALILAGGIFYFSNSNNEKENKVLVNNTKIETSLQKEKVEKTNKKETSKTEVKKEDNNPRGPVIYKNTSENEGYNMELKVPAKWAHLDYSRLGQPKEVALKPEDYVTTDISNKKVYLDDEAEKKLLDLYQDKEIKDIFLRVYDDEYGQKRFDYENKYIADLDGTDSDISDDEYITIEKFYSDINNLIKINEESGRKEENHIYDGFGFYLSYICGANGPWETGCDTYQEAVKNNPPLQSLTEEEFDKVMKFMEELKDFDKKTFHIKRK